MALLLTKVGAIVQRWWCNVHLYLGNLIPTSRHQALALSPTQVPSPAGGSCLRHRRPEAAHRPVATAGLDVAHSYDSPGRGLPVGGPEEGTASLPSWCVAWIKKQTIEHLDSTFCCIVCDRVRENLRPSFSWGATLVGFCLMRCSASWHRRCAHLAKTARVRAALGVERWSSPSLVCLEFITSETVLGALSSAPACPPWNNFI